MDADIPPSRTTQFDLTESLGRVRGHGGLSIGHKSQVFHPASYPKVSNYCPLRRKEVEGVLPVKYLLDRCDICGIRRNGILDNGLFQCERCNPSLVVVLREEQKAAEDARWMAAHLRKLDEQERWLPPEAPPNVPYIEYVPDIRGVA